MTRDANTVRDRTLHELAAATAALVEQHDTVGTITHLLSGTARAVGADAASLLLRSDRTGRLELLAATSHRAAELELHQLHSDQGPCVEASEEGRAISTYGTEDLTAAWPELAEVFAKNQFTAAHATPLRWHGRDLGAIGLFFVHPPVSQDQQPIDDAAQVFADVATLTVTHTSDLPPDELLTQIRAALAERTVVEQAKGVLAHSTTLAMDVAFDRLVALSVEQREPITTVASQIITAAAHRPD